MTKATPAFNAFVNSRRLRVLHLPAIGPIEEVLTRLADRLTDAYGNPALAKDDAAIDGVLRRLRTRSTACSNARGCSGVPCDWACVVGCAIGHRTSQGGILVQRKRWIFAILAILPTLAIFACVRIYPIGETLRLSLHKWDILSKNKPFIGFANFDELPDDPLFREALLNTTIIAFGVLLVTIPLALFLAALIHHRTRSRFAGFYETAIFIPHVVSLVPAAMAWKWIFDARLGPLNALLTDWASSRRPGSSIRCYRSSASSCSARGRRSAMPY